jgi:hypothetical protein
MRGDGDAAAAGALAGPAESGAGDGRAALFVIAGAGAGEARSLADSGLAAGADCVVRLGRATGAAGRVERWGDAPAACAPREADEALA